MYFQRNDSPAAFFFGLAVAVAATAVGSPALADSDGTKGTMQATANIGYAYSFNNSVNPYGLHMGLRAGKTFKTLPLYAGLEFNYFMGDTLSRQNAANYIHTGAEAGFDIHLAPVVLRLSLGAGVGILQGNLNPGGVTTTSNVTPYLAPGAGVYIPLAIFLIGVDARGYLAPLSDHMSSLAANAIVGLAF